MPINKNRTQPINKKEAGVLGKSISPKIDGDFTNAFLYRAGSSLYGDCQVKHNDKKRDFVELLD